MDKNYKIQINYPNKDFCVEGDMQFVEKYFDIISSKLETSNIKSSGPTKEGQEDKKIFNSDYEGTIYAFEDGNVHLFIKKIPGKSKAEQTINLTCLYAYFMSKHGINTIESGAVRELCEIFGCLDKKNFAHHLKSMSDKFIITGSTNKSLKINRPGMMFAETILAQLNETA